MSALKYRDGGVTVTLTGDLATWAEAAIRRATGDAVAVVQRELGAVASEAEAQWYGPAGVQSRTGQSGQMEVTTTIDQTRGVVRVSVWSADQRRVGKKQIAPAAYIHRPGANSVALAVVTEAEYYAAPKSTRFCRARIDGAKWKVPTPGIKAGDYVVQVHNPRASDGKKLAPVFIYGPGKSRIAAALPEIGTALARGIAQERVK